MYNYVKYNKYTADKIVVLPQKIADLAMLRFNLQAGI